MSGSYGTKLEAVVRRLLAILRANPSARILVFSSWQVTFGLRSMYFELIILLLFVNMVSCWQVT